VKKSTHDVVRAAGALVWRIGDSGDLEVLAVHRPRYDDWSWPKGKLDSGETLPACAVREVAEETRASVELGPKLTTLRYSLANGRTKTATYWAARVIDDGSPAVAARGRVKRASKHEIDDVRWMSVKEARATITLADDLRPLKKLESLHAKGLLATRAFMVVRHARAKRRSAWFGKDVRRPITRGGRARAKELIGLFAAFGASRVASSTAVRCVQTVHPYAEAAGIPVRGLRALREGSYAKDPEATIAAFRDQLFKKRSRVVCVHRPTMPALMGVLNSLVTASTRGSLPRTMPYLPAGGVLVAHIATQGEPRIVSIETHVLKPRN